MYRILILLTGFVFLAFSLSGCINQNQSYIGTIDSSGYPPIAENVPLCIVALLVTSDNTFYLTENENPSCDFYGLRVGDNVEITGYIHYIQKYGTDESFMCLEIENIKRM